MELIKDILYGLGIMLLVCLAVMVACVLVVLCVEYPTIRIIMIFAVLFKFAHLIGSEYRR